MAPRRPRARRRPAGLEHQHGLLARDRLRRVEEPPALAAEALDVEADRRRLLVLRQILQVLGHRQVRLVPDREARPYADAPRNQLRPQARRVRPALRHDRHAARRRRRRPHDVEVRRRRVDPLAVRPREPQPAVLGCPQRLLLELQPLASRLLETGRDHDRGLHSRGGALPHDLGHEHGADDDDGQVHALRNVADRGVRPQPLDLGLARMHRVQPALEAGPLRAVHDPSAPPAQIVRRPDDRHGFRAEQRVQLLLDRQRRHVPHAPPSPGCPAGPAKYIRLTRPPSPPNAGRRRSARLLRST